MVATLSGSVIQVTANRNSLTLTGTTSNYVANFMQAFTMGSNPITGAASLNVDGVGPISLRDNEGSSLSSSTILAGQRCLVVKDGTNGYFRLLYPNRKADSGDILTTQGDVLFRDGSGLQRLGIGTANQVLAVNAGATAPEYQTLSTGFEFVSTAAVTAAANIDITGFAAGYDYLVQLEAICPAVDSEVLYMRFSDDGSTFEADAADYGWQHYTGGVLSSDESDSEIQLAGTGGAGTALGNDAGNVNTFTVTIPNPNAGSEKTTCFWNGMIMGDGVGVNPQIAHGIGVFLQGNDAVQGVRFLWSGAGNFKAQGDVTVYRRKRS